MAATDNELDFEVPTYFRVYRNGRVERLAGNESLPAGVDPQTGVASKDVTDIVPLLVYTHGGAFCLFSPSSVFYHNYLNALVSESQIVAVSVHYRRAPEHPLPVPYEDSWAALQWVASHRSGDGPEAVLNQHADFRRVFLAGDSAGGNIAHNLAMRAGSADAGLNLEILGIALVDPYFWGSKPVRSELLDPDGRAFGDQLWRLLSQSSGLDHDDPKINPVAEGGPSLPGLGCRRVLVSVAEKDILRDRGRLYFEVLGGCGWMGMVEIHEVEGEGHCFHLFDLNHEKAKERMRRMSDFFNRH